jgi:hypothetical protein
MMLKEAKHCFPAVALEARARPGCAQARQMWGQFLQVLLKALAVWAV